MKRSQQGNALEQFIQLKGSAAQLARAIGVSPSLISRVRTGNRRLTAQLKLDLIEKVSGNVKWAHAALETGGLGKLVVAVDYERKMRGE